MRQLYWTPSGATTEINLEDWTGSGAGRYAQIFCTEIVNPAYPDDEPQQDEIPSLDMAVDRGVAFKPRVITAKFILIASSPSNLALAIRAWDALMNPRLGVGQLRHVAEDGTSRILEARPKSPKWTVRGVWARVEQSWYAANPWWRSQTDAIYVTAFNGTTPVVVNVQNDGILPAPPTFRIVGIVSQPKMVNTSGEVIELLASTSYSDDLLVVNCSLGQPKVMYYRHGTGGGTRWFGYRTAATKFWEVPVGASAITLQAESGTASCTISFPRYYGDI